MIEKSKISKLFHDGDIVNFIQCSYSGERKKQLQRVITDLGYRSSHDIVNDYLQEDKNLSYTDVSKLIKNKEYFSIEVSAFARNFNQQRGMYLYDKPNLKYVVIKSTITDNENPYNDSWIIKDKEFKYYLQTETLENREINKYSHKPNKVLYESLLNKSNIPIHLFHRLNKKDKFIYSGTFIVKNISKNGDYFIIINRKYIWQNRIVEKRRYKM